MEFAGVVLGVLPILISAAEGYSKLYKVCKRFANCRDEVRRLLECLDVHKTIFVKETELLLTAAVGAEKARTMLHDPSHPNWNDLNVASFLDELLGDWKSALSSTVQTLQQKMKAMEDEIKSIDYSNHSTEGADGQQRHRLLRIRFRVAFSESRLKALNTSIRETTHDYRIMRGQIQHVTTTRPNALTQSDYTAQLARVRATQAAATRVYEVLITACTLHTKHHAHFSLGTRYGDSDVSQEIMFKMAYRQTSHYNADYTPDALWFLVESVVSGTVPVPTPIPVPAPVTQTEPLERSSKRRPKGIRSSLLSILRLNATATTESDQSQTLVPPPDICTKEGNAAALPNLLAHQNFCTRLQACCDNLGNESEICIGWLENTDQWKHRVYGSRGPRQYSEVKEQTMTPRTLASILSSRDSQKSPEQGLHLVQRLRLARLLSTAVLNLYATPWMQSCLSSGEIVLYDAVAPTEDSETQYSELEPFVEVPVSEVHEHQGDGHGHNNFDPLFARNVILYNLGVMLLELAFERPLRAMRWEVDSVAGLPPSMTDFQTAVRQCKGVSSSMGPKYSNIVEKCLYCDFGQGADLSHPALQHAVYKEVVCELSRLEKGLQGVLGLA